MKTKHRFVARDRCLALWCAWWSGYGLMGALYGPVTATWQRGIFGFGSVFLAVGAVAVTRSLWKRVDRPYVNDQEADERPTR